MPADLEKRCKSTENKLISKNEAWFRALFNEAPDTIFIFSMDNRILDANIAASRMLGYTREEFLSMTLADLQAPEIQKTMGGSITNELSLGNVFEGVDIHKDGRRIPIEIHNHRMILQGREIVLSIVRNITDRKQVEEDLSGTYVSTREGRLVACNREYMRIFGFKSTQQALDTPVNRLFKNPDSRDEFLKLIEKQKRVTYYKPELKKIDGTPVSVVENVSGVFDRQGNLTRIRGFLLDVTEQRELEIKLLQAQKMEAIGTLAGGIAHDFNNILSGIFGYSQLAEKHIDNPSKAKRHIAEIIKGSKRAAELVRQILTFSRQSEYQKHPLKIYTAINEALKLLRASIPPTIEIKEKIDSRQVASADPTRIHQLILNLCTNAYHAIGKTGGTITVSLTDITSCESVHLKDKEMPPGEYLKLEVSDTGQGMDKQTLQRAFDPYFTTKGMGQGTGLGLALVRAIVDEHEGFLDVISVPEKGTSFYIYFPVIKEKTRPPPDENPP